MGCIRTSKTSKKIKEEVNNLKSSVTSPTRATLIWQDSDVFTKINVKIQMITLSSSYMIIAYIKNSVLIQSGNNINPNWGGYINRHHYAARSHM
jgi:hypothetical protein